MIFCLVSEFKPRTLKEISLNSWQSDLTLVSLLLTYRLSLLGSVFLLLSLSLVRLPYSVSFLGSNSSFLLDGGWVFSCSFFLI